MEWEQISDKNEKGENTELSEHVYRDKTDKTILRKAPWKDYKLHLTIVVLVIISEFIGPINFNITKDICVIIMPLLYAMVLGLVLFLLKPVKWIGRKQAKIAESAMLLFIGPLIAKLAVSSGQSFHILLEVGPTLILQEFGHIFGCVLLALPVALLLGFKRETVGMTNSIGRETNVAIVIDRYGFDSPETTGVLTVFIIGTVIGTLYISFLSCLCVSILPLHPYAFAMGSGIGSASMNAAALAPLLEAFPASMSTNIEAFAGFSNLISFCLGMYFCIFLAIPLAEKLYDVLEPKIGRTTSVSNIEEEE